MEPDVWRQLHIIFDETDRSTRYIIPGPQVIYKEWFTSHMRQSVVALDCPVPKPKYAGKAVSIQLLVKIWLLASPDHQHSGYWLWRLSCPCPRMRGFHVLVSSTCCLNLATVKHNKDKFRSIKPFKPQSSSQNTTYHMMYVFLCGAKCVIDSVEIDHLAYIAFLRFDYIQFNSIHHLFSTHWSHTNT